MSAKAMNEAANNQSNDSDDSVDNINNRSQ